MTTKPADEYDFDAATPALPRATSPMTIEEYYARRPVDQRPPRWHISFAVGGRVHSDRVQGSIDAAHARLDLLVERAEVAANLGRARHLAPIVAERCAIRPLEDPEVSAALARCRGAGRARRGYADQ